MDPSALAHLVAPVVFVIFALRARRRGAVGLPSVRAIAWGVSAVLAVTMALPVGVLFLGFLAQRHPLVAVLAGLVLLAATVLAVVWMSATWWLLQPLAARGRADGVYWTALLSPLFLSTRETRAGAILLYAIALAKRPACTAAERERLAARLAREPRGLGVYGAALALWHALEARAAEHGGDPARAAALREDAWALFGTVTYFSERGLPWPVRRLAEEYLALDAARRGLWAGLTNVSEAPRGLLRRRLVTAPVLAMRAYVTERLSGQSRSPAEARAVAEVASPVVDGLFARIPPAEVRDARGARARATAAYAALCRGEAIGPRETLGMIAMFDVLLEPTSPDTVLPEETRSDEALVAAVQDEAAAAIADAVLPTTVPLTAFSRFGPISARIFQRVESELFGRLTQALRRLDEARKAGSVVTDARALWLELSRLRMLYRRIQFTLGDAAVARVCQAFAFSFCNLGVDMTKHAPLRRPLAHSVFHVLHGEAVRFGDESLRVLQANNMRITAGRL